MRWGLKHLTDNQDVQSKLIEELHKAYPDALAEKRAPTLEEIIKSRIHYLDAVTEEILRYSTVLPLTMRDTLVATEVMGIPVPKGTTVALVGGGPGITKKTLGANAKKYESSKPRTTKYGQFDDADIEDFVPERWLKQVKGADGAETLQFDPMAGANFSFGLGPRGCAGKKLAYLELKIVFVMMFWTFKFREVPEPYAAHEEVVFTARAPKFVYAKLERN